jgi:rare lipoprotein A (peptidoglycan hydrolase)
VPFLRSSSARVQGALVAATCLVLGVFGPTVPAGGHPVKSFWQYDKALFRHGWKHHDGLDELHRKYHRDHPEWDATAKRRKQHARFHHETLVHKHRRTHFHRVLADQRGDAVWYQANGDTGACGKPLTGKYAAHRSWPCGSLVSVRKGDDYVFVRILDRGPFGDPKRKIDLSRKAFKRLAHPGTGVIGVKIYRLED